MKKAIVIVGTVLLLTIGILLMVSTGIPNASNLAAAQENQRPEREIIVAVEQVINGKTQSGSVRINYLDSDVLPSEQETALGLLLSHTDDTIVVGTSSIEFEVKVEVINDEEPVTAVNASHDGGEILVGISNDTLIYVDVTGHPEVTPADIEAGIKLIQRNVVPGSIEDLAENTIIRVWGPYMDGRISADTLVIEPIN